MTDRLDRFPLKALPSVMGMRPEDVLSYWLETVSPSEHFNATPELDARIRERFGTLVEALEAAGYPHVWEGTPDGALALVIALDQFPRNIHRGEAGAFLRDTLALDVAQRAIGRGFLDEVAHPKWLLMPLMHSEDLEVQEAGVALFAEHADAKTLAHAKAHRDEIRRFGRFPARNAALGRESTEVEREYLEGGGYKEALGRYK